MYKLLIILSLALLLIGCSTLDKETIALTAQKSMQDKFNTSPEFQPYELTITGLDVFHAGGNKYKGIARIIWIGGFEDHVPFDIIVDGNHVLWDIKQESFLFIQKYEFEKVVNTLY